MKLRTCESRSRVSFRASLSGSLRMAKFDGRDHLVVPVVALVEGVIHAVNSEYAELVLASEFEKVPAAWDGRPVLWDHPSLNGARVPASEPLVLERMAFGTLFYTKVEDRSLKSEAWIDLVKTERIAEAQKVVRRLQMGEIVEISVGAFVDVEDRIGERDGKRFSGAWKNIVPDHLAFLPEGTTGACSVEMGCGAPRAAAKGDEKMSLRQKFMAALEKFTNHLPPVGDSDVRTLLDQQLFALEPGFLGVVEVFSDTSQVVYAIAPDGQERHRRRSFEIVDGAPKLRDEEPEEVQLQAKFVPLAGKITERDGKFCHEGADGKDVCHDTREEAESSMSKMKETKTASTDDCGCGGKKKVETLAENKKEEAVDKKARVAALIAVLSLNKKPLFVAADAAVLEGLSEDRLKALEDAAKVEEISPAPTAAVVKELTPEEMLAKMPDVQAIVTEHKAAAARKKADVIALITASAVHKDVYSKEELEAMPLDSLEKVGRLVAAASAVKVDQSGRALPRMEPGPDAPPKPIDLRERILARNKQSA